MALVPCSPACAGFAAPSLAPISPHAFVGRSPWRAPRRLTLHLRVARPRVGVLLAQHDAPSVASASTSGRRIGVAPAIAASAASSTEATSTTTEQASGGGFFGVKARAYWEGMGFIPLFFAGFGVAALAIKMIKVMQGRWTDTAGANRAMMPDSVITNEEQKSELHAFRCGNCGYVIYPARGREFKFFPDNFKCPLCRADKSMFWDLNDPNDPRNQDDGEQQQDLQHASTSDPNSPLASDGDKKDT